MYLIFETLTAKQKQELFLMHYRTEEYNNQNTVYGYQLSAIGHMFSNLYMPGGNK